MNSVGTKMLRRATWGRWVIRSSLAGLLLAVTGCAHAPEPGEVIAKCGPQYRLRAKQVRLPSNRPGVATVDIVTSDRYENIAETQIGLRSRSGDFYIDELPRSFGYTNSRGQLRVEWHPAEPGGDSESAVLEIQALDFPGDCSLDLQVDVQP